MILSGCESLSAENCFFSIPHSKKRFVLINPETNRSLKTVKYSVGENQFLRPFTESLPASNRI